MFDIQHMINIGIENLDNPKSATKNFSKTKITVSYFLLCAMAANLNYSDSLDKMHFNSHHPLEIIQQASNGHNWRNRIRLRY